MISFSPTMIGYVNKSSNNCSLRLKKNLVLIVVGTFDEDISNIMPYIVMKNWLHIIIIKPQLRPTDECE